MTDVESGLRRLAASEPWPPTPDIATAVANALPAHARARPRAVGGRRRVAVVALAAAVMLPAGAALAFPDARDDVLEWLGLRSVEVRRSPEPPQGRQTEPRVDLGRRVTLAEARQQAGFDSLVPAVLGPPDAVRVQDGRVSLVYREPRARRIAVLITEQRGLGVVAEKVLGPGTRVRSVDVAGSRGAWITGNPHAIVFEYARGRFRDDELRLAGDTLVWERDGFVHRIEGARSLREALRIARSLR